MQLYTYYRSSAAFRVRIALNLKGIAADPVYVHLTRDGGEQHRDEYKALNPQELVPALVDGEHVLTQSLAIIEYLDETHPQPPLLPADAPGRARVRSLAQAIACDLHPINNLRVLQYLSRVLKLDEAARNSWYRHWVMTGLAPLEERLARERETGRYAHGDTPGLADCCLVPQLANARRYDVDLAAYPTLTRIEAQCFSLQAFTDALPEKQVDAA
jgi:maleylacetoacetate isomerase